MHIHIIFNHKIYVSLLLLLLKIYIRNKAIKVNKNHINIEEMKWN